MALHKRYDLIRALVDAHFVTLSRAAHALNPDLDRIEIWHDVLEAALAADREYQGELNEEWEIFILDAAKRGIKYLP